MPEPGLRASTGVDRLPRYHEPLRLPRRPKAGHFRPPGWWTRPTTTMDLARCLKDLVRMLTPLPRLERTGSQVGCSPGSPTAFPLWQEGRLQRETIEACSGFSFISACVLAPWLRQGLLRRLQWTISRLNCSSGYRANRQFPGRDLHPRAFETQEVSPQTDSQLTSDLLSCRTAKRFAGPPVLVRSHFRNARNKFRG